MWIFYKHLPRNVTLNEIRKVTIKGARSAWSPLSLFKRPKIKHSKIIRIKDLQQETTEYHAIVQVNPASLIETIIKNLDGKTINGLYLRTHCYQRRFSSRDRRTMRGNIHQYTERRKSDRRRESLVTRIMDIS